MVLKSLLAGAVAFFFCGSVSVGQTLPTSDQSFLQTLWTTENGLPQNSVTAIAQTPDGYLWLGTFGGLARFDGVKFTVFNTANTPALENNRITALYVTRDGALWIGGENGELLRYFGGNFVYHPLAASANQIIIRAFYEDNAGDLWIAAGGPALLRLKRGDPARIEKFTEADGLPTPDVFSFCEDAEGVLWIGTRKGLAKFRNGKFSPYPLDVPQWKPPIVIRLRPHPKGGLWVATATCFGHLVNDRFTPYLEFPKDFTFFFGLIEDKDAALWLCFRPDRIQHLKDGKITTTRLSEIPEYSLRTLFKDLEGNLWIGTNGKGLIRLRKARVKMFAEAEGLPVTAGPGAIVQDGQGDVWIGTNIGLYRVSENRVTTYLDDPGKQGKGRWGSLNIGALYADKAGGLWIGKVQQLIHYKDGRFTEYPFDQFKFISAIIEDRQGRLWLGTLQGLVLFQAGKFTQYGPSDGLVHDDVKFLMEDRAEALWIGTVGGLSRFKDGVFTNFTTRQGLSNNYVRDVYEDPDGAFWIATYGGGLNRMQAGRITAITSKHGLFDDFISRILPGDGDQLWLLGNRGVFRAGRQELNDLVFGRTQRITGTVFDAADGMTSSEGNGGRQPAGWRMRDGSLWFPTIGGVARINTREHNATPPPVLIEQTLLNGSPLDFRQPLQITPDPESLEIHYTGLSLGKPEMVRFQYQLLGLDKDWIESATRRIAYYPHLPPGHYTFRVKAVSPDGIWSLREARLAITVKPPFWQTAWFLSHIVLVLAGTILLGYRLRVSQYRRRTAQQEAFARELIASQERDRQRIAAEIHDGLGQSLVIIKRRAMTGLEKPYDPERMLEQLQEIAEASDDAIDEVRDAIFDLRPQQLDRLGLTGAISDLLDRIAEAHGWRLSKHLDELDGVLVKEAENSLYRIVQEGINNIGKHAEASQVAVSLNRRANTIELAIVDDGVGFKADAALLEANQRGFGLRGIIERTRLLGGQSFIDSIPGKGTEIKLQLPLK